MATSRTGKEACDLLDAYHRAIKKLFKTYEELAGSRARSAGQKKLDLSRRISLETTVHLQIEEELFHPALRAVIKDTDLLDGATVENDLIKELVAQIQQGEPRQHGDGALEGFEQGDGPQAGDAGGPAHARVGVGGGAEGARASCACK